jgi:hypothetical protein
MLRSGRRSAYMVRRQLSQTQKSLSFFGRRFLRAARRPSSSFVHSDQQRSQFGRQFSRQHYLA